MCKKLNEYLDDNRITNEIFGKEIGVSNASVSRYRNGERIPELGIMKNISCATNGVVTPNDFYMVANVAIPQKPSKSITKIKGVEKPPFNKFRVL